MKQFPRLWKIAALAGCGGVFWMWGAGSCLPYDFYSNLLGDAIIATVVSTISSSLADALIPAP